MIYTKAARGRNRKTTITCYFFRSLAFLAPLIRRQKPHGNRVKASQERFREKIVDLALTVNTPAPLEITANNYKFKMRLAGTIVAGMTGMFMTFIDHLQMLDLQIFFEGALDQGFNVHNLLF